MYCYHLHSYSFSASSILIGFLLDINFSTDDGVFSYVSGYRIDFL